MCGIAGFYLRDPSLAINADSLTSTLLYEMEERGQHATGVVALDSDGVAEWQKASCDATTFNRHRRIIPSGVRVVLGHTRWATQGLPAFIENNHPIRRGPFYIIHNGHVSNDDAIFRQAERYRFGDVDSEAIAALLADKKDLALLGDVMSEIEGDAAVAAVDERDHTRLALARGRSSPLWVYNGKRIVIFASTEKAVVNAHARHIGQIAASRLTFMKEGEMWEWRNGELFKTEFPVKERKYTWAGGQSRWHWTLGDDYTWRQEYAGELTEKSESTVVDTSETVRDREADEDTVICDNCSRVTWWDEAEHRWVRDENISFLLCPECADDWDDDWIDGRLLGAKHDDPEFLGGPGDWDEVDERGYTLLNDFDPALIEDEGPVDDYANANEHIIKRLANKLKGD